MPPIDYLRTLPGSKLWQPPDPNEQPGLQDPSLQLYGLTDALKSDAQDRLFTARRTGDANEAAALQGLIGDYTQTQAESPIGRQQRDLIASDAANQAAQRAGYGAAGQDAITTPSAQMASAGRAQEMYKTAMPLLVEKEKARAAEQQQQDVFQNMLRLHQLQSGNLPGGAPQGAGAGGPGTPAPTGEAPSAAVGTGDKATPYQTPTWHDILLGGPTAAKYGTFGDLLGAGSEWAKYRLGALPQDNPFSEAMVRQSFSNLNQIQTMFPGVRGVSHLMDVFAQHQGALGREIPAGTYARVNTMVSLLNDLERDLYNETGRIKLGSSGKYEMENDPQQLRRAIGLLQDTRDNLIASKQYMQKIWPGIGQPGSGSNTVIGR